MGTSAPRVTDAPGNVGLGTLVFGVCEKEVGWAELGENSGAMAVERRLIKHEARRHVAHATRLFHVVGHDDDCEVFLQVVHQVFDAGGRDRVKRRAGLVHQDDFGLNGERPRNPKPLLLPSRQVQSGSVELGLHFVHRAARRNDRSTSSLMSPRYPLIRAPQATLL